ncbi:MAG: cobalamin biosynthesis protein [Deltaproteobacteria bacterium]|nr:cobalamin biosynthesis protein [Deltaproteobacteria bacterium]
MNAPADPNFKIAVYALTIPGLIIAEKICAGLRADLHIPKRLMDKTAYPAKAFEGFCRHMSGSFFKYQGHVVIAATGLAVRAVAPFVRDKKSDPAVVSLGQDGKYAISLLSGHLGGGNDLARKVAAITGGSPVINTATDIASKPAMEVVARNLGLVVENFARLPAVSRELSEGGKVPVYDPDLFLLPELAQWADSFPVLDSVAAFDPENPAYPKGPSVYVGYRAEALPPEALALRPPVLSLGVGCHRGLAFAELEKFLDKVFAEFQIARRSIVILSTVETRVAEPALLELAKSWAIPLITHSKETLSTVSTPNPSQMVFSNIGVSSVCEAAALLAAKMGPLLVPKQKCKTATCAIALLP